MYSSRYGDPIARILAAYASGPGLIAALETLIKTAEDNARTRVRDELAAQVCEQLHAGPPTGLKCRACYEAESGIAMQNQVDAEIEMVRREKQGGEDIVLDGVLID